MNQEKTLFSLSMPFETSSAVGGFGALIDSIPLGIYRVDVSAEWALTGANSAFLSMFEAGSVSELKSFASLIPDPDDFKKLNEALNSHGHFRGHELAFRTARNRVFWGATTAIKIKQEHGFLVEGIIEDISERRKHRESSMRVEEELQASEEKYRKLVEAANDAIFLVCAETGTILEANKKAGELLGKSSKRLIGANIGSLFPSEDRQFYHKHIFENIRREKNARLTALVSFRNGKYKIPVQISSSIIELRGQRLVLCLVSDITELKRFEETLRIEKNGLEKLIDKKTLEIFKIQNKLESARRLSDIGTLASTVAHELRNPLGVINAAVYNIKKKNSDPGLAEHLGHIEKKILESDQIIKNLLSYSKINLPHREPVRILELLEECAGEIKKKYAYPDVIVTLEGNCERNAMVEADPVHLSELFTNILDNAFQALENKKGRIALMLDYRRNSNRCEVRFEDTGRGMDPEELEKVFEPFFTRKTKGIGLGMTVCRQIVSLHAGTIDIQSVRGKGTTVCVNIPIKSKA